ncbi:hypothetical protein GCM10007350_33900 [Jeongeupia chitinilytica]|uniref:Photosystem I assembly protein Ycf4 n=2 Tax=Jeongeupia chitinilytica TaxID=1041641 RepID=A0ABQ3H3G2_9NEIS|nr:hypothetical protein GCM10007350_33900 [Jeongeupia chitinilytica]
MFLGVGVWISWDVYHDPYGTFYHDLIGLVLFNSGFFFMCFLIFAGVGFQRVKLNRETKKLIYANYSTFHRWKEVDVADIQRVSIWLSRQSMDALVDSLLITIRAHASGGPPRGVTLLDFRVAPMNKKNHSSLFVAVVEFVRESNPNSELPDFQ